jgi:putative flippase GtrA
MATLNERAKVTGFLRAGWIEQGFKFLIVGMLNTGVDFALYFLLTRLLFETGEMTVLAKGISYSAGVVNSYVWNRSWTFESGGGPWKTFLPFALVNLIGLGINAGTLWLGVHTAGLPEFPALILATGATLIWNFIISKFVIFRK